MPCEPLTKNGKVVGWICSRSKEKPKPEVCYICGKPATKLCDFRIWGLNHGEDAYGRKTKSEYASLSTCDKPMCTACSYHIKPDKDYCQEHSSELMLEHTRRADAIHDERIRRMEERER